MEGNGGALDPSQGTMNMVAKNMLCDVKGWHLH